MQRVLTDSIPSALSEIAHERGIELLYACVSGSQIWGTATSRSDYDVRFIFAQPMGRYLSLDGAPSVIDVGLIRGADGVPLDISGWDIFKALSQLRKGNAQIIEWLVMNSAGQVNYACSDPFAEECLAVLRDLHRPDVLFENYRGQMREALPGMMEERTREEIAEMLSRYQMSPKSLLYTIRGAVNAWFVRNLQAYPPANLREALLFPALSEWEGIRYELEDVMRAREDGAQRVGIPSRVRDLVAVIDEVPRLKCVPGPEALERATHRLNDIARRWIPMK